MLLLLLWPFSAGKISIGYSVGKVEEEAINRVAQENVMNALVA
ncbi:MAG: hypothetical protein R3B93_11740 [Bacteroidia bacterium]